MFNQQQIYLFGQIQISQIGGQPYSDPSSDKVSECSMFLPLPIRAAVLLFKEVSP